MRGDVDYPARQELHKLGMTNDEIRAHAMNMAIGIGSVRQLDAKLWSVVSDFRQELGLGCGVSHLLNLVPHLLAEIGVGLMEGVGEDEVVRHSAAYARFVTGMASPGTP
jgi:hypothetical protein